MIQVVREAFVQGVSTRKMDKQAKSLGIENLSRSQVSDMTKGFNVQIQWFRERPLVEQAYPVLWAVRYSSHVVSVWSEETAAGALHAQLCTLKMYVIPCRWAFFAAQG